MTDRCARNAVSTDKTTGNGWVYIGATSKHSDQLKLNGSHSHCSVFWTSHFGVRTSHLDGTDVKNLYQRRQSGITKFRSVAVFNVSGAAAAAAETIGF